MAKKKSAKRLSGRKPAGLARHQKIQPSLHRRLENSLWSRILVKLKDPEEFEEAAAMARGDMRRKARTRQASAQHLKECADHCQQQCCSYIDSLLPMEASRLVAAGFKLPDGKTPGLERYWINNSLVLDATCELICGLADRDDVAYVEQLHFEEPLRLLDGQTLAESQVTWGLQRLRIPEIWARGFRGQGMKIAHLDTGVDGTHPDLTGKINQFVFVLSDGTRVPFAAFDTDDHGTHTAGTIVGGSTQGISIGVAPDARLLSAAVIEGGQVINRVLSGMEWAIEQDADVISMSLGFQTSGFFGVSPATFETAVNNLIFADVFPTIAIGNEGVGTGRTPGLNVMSWSVGATDRSDRIAGFSSGLFVNRPSDRVQPDVSAPGVDVRSALPGGGHGFNNGTSMATPHVAGVAALLRQAAPGASVSDIKTVLAQTALDLGRFGDDIRFGFGRIQPVDALNALLS